VDSTRAKAINVTVTECDQQKTSNEL